MKNAPVNKADNIWTVANLIPLFAIAILVIASGFVVFSSRSGLMQEASAQVNVPKIGEQVGQQVTESGGRTSLDQAREEEPPTTEQELAGEQEITTIAPPEDMPGETAELPGTEKTFVQYDLGPGSPYYISREGIGGKRFTELTPDELYEQLSKVSMVAQQPEPARKIMMEILMPVMLRFQYMVSPKPELKPGEKEPWVSGARRYSPFDVVGGGGPPVGPTKPVPPFPPLEQVGGLVSQGPSAQQVASAIRIIGILGEEGSYLAILNVAGVEKKVSVGDEVATVDESAFVVTEITMNAVRIANRARPADQGLIQFTSRKGIADISISY